MTTLAAVLAVLLLAAVLLAAVWRGLVLDEDAVLLP